MTLVSGTKNAVIFWGFEIWSPLFFWVDGKYPRRSIPVQMYADDSLPLGKPAAVVMNLVKGLEHKNYDVYMDNYHTSVQLFLALADKGNWCMWHNTSKSQVRPEGCSCR